MQFLFHYLISHTLLGIMYVKFGLINKNDGQSRVAQWIERSFPKRQVVGSNPISGVSFWGVANPISGVSFWGVAKSTIGFVVCASARLNPQQLVLRSACVRTN